jgi:hypothetical protein
VSKVGAMSGRTMTPPIISTHIGQLPSRQRHRSACRGRTSASARASHRGNDLTIADPGLL